MWFEILHRVAGVPAPVADLLQRPHNLFLQTLQAFDRLFIDDAAVIANIEGQFVSILRNHDGFVAKCMGNTHFIKDIGILVGNFCDDGVTVKNIFDDLAVDVEMPNQFINAFRFIAGLLAGRRDTEFIHFSPFLAERHDDKTQFRRGCPRHDQFSLVVIRSVSAPVEHGQGGFLNAENHRDHVRLHFLPISFFSGYSSSKYGNRSLVRYSSRPVSRTTTTGTRAFLSFAKFFMRKRRGKPQP
ncbi:MAG: hypothetical protein ILNGONEN_00563 [Syntrophorhabdaceae bacterium]|nr:hypothetical protein [Syntrophorhabdaceae bacterium]